VQQVLLKQNSKEANMKLSVFTLVTPDLTPEELGVAVKEAGIHGIEWRYKGIPAEAVNQKPSFWGNNICSIDPEVTDGELDRFHQAAVNNGLAAAGVMPYVACGDFAGTERVMQVAQKLGAGLMRVGVPGYNRTRNYNELYAEAVQFLHQVQELAQQYKVKAIVETHHGLIVPSAASAHRLVSNFNPDHIGVLFDPGNMVHEGYENHRMGLELLGPYLAHVHIKNAEWAKTGKAVDGSVEWKAAWCPMDQGVVNWKQVMDDLKSVGYDGYLGVEDFSQQYDSKTLLHHFANKVKEWLA
jgi:sugar phosphate isomerase/epimerase